MAINFPAISTPRRSLSSFFLEACLESNDNALTSQLVLRLAGVFPFLQFLHFHNLYYLHNPPPPILKRAIMQVIIK
jgi:hypothetical protein